MSSRAVPIPQDIQTAISEHLAANRNALELLQQAATRQHCRFPVDFTVGSDVRASAMAKLLNCYPNARWLGDQDPLAHIDLSLYGVKLLNLQAILQGQNKQTEAAAESSAAAIRIART